MTIVLGAKEDAPWSTCFHPVKPLLDRSMETRQSVRGTFSSNTKLDHADIKSTKVLSILLKNVKSRRRRKTTHKYLRQRMIFSLLADLKKRFQFPEKNRSCLRRWDQISWYGRQQPSRSSLFNWQNPEKKLIEAVYERKKVKYGECRSDCEHKGLKAWCKSVEIGCTIRVNHEQNRRDIVIHHEKTE